MKTKEFITSVNGSLLTKEERKLKMIWLKHPEFTMEEAVEFMKTGQVVKKEKAEKQTPPPPEPKPAAPKPKPKATASKPKAKPKPKKK